MTKSKTATSQQVDIQRGNSSNGPTNVPDTTKQQQQDARKSRAFRRQLITAAKTILSSVVDIVGDWVFYTRSKVNLSLDEFHLPLLIVCIISSVFGFLTILGVFTKLVNAQRNAMASKSNTQDDTRWCFGTKCGSWFSAIKSLLVLEIFLEDVPQFIMTAIITAERAGGVLSPVATFNLTTSGMNLLFNILDMLMPEDEEMLDDGTTENLVDDHDRNRGYGATDQQKNSSNALVDSFA
mmetsp:Transcript_13055/g.24524  ORF Transcript_13055/g.24524 Transcript_13055/m.24524 type:complete len:238 (-) Transcript_13055:165-878(-)|eukprot:CAMPEP_0176479964 /NCGR_PEP_ID=MMETSP0200_2-20121128/2027_1 /TAXON_ID=947934 /ORGANISM="Chaetoceros sp., Strain GSL56" /LENGTH=237 /DNA_ID=CAMNT_0017876057 /DNA_START=150 /DNA_END=863 /DNA_ORIENTATION=-